MRTLGVLSKPYTTVFDVPIIGVNVDDVGGNYSPTISGAVAVGGGVAIFHNSSSERISYYPFSAPQAKLRLQTDTEFTLRFAIAAKGGVGRLMSCLNAAGDNGFSIFVNDTFPALGFYGVGIGTVFTSAPIPIGVFTTVRCVFKKSTNQLIIYVDNVLAGTLNGADFSGITNEPRYVHLGVLSDTNTSQPLNGTIDYVLIKDKTG